MFVDRNIKGFGRYGFEGQCSHKEDSRAKLAVKTLMLHAGTKTFYQN